jgi:dCMP deaminase
MIQVEKTQEDKQEKLDKLYLRMAQIWAENSYCKRSQVGCIIVKNRTIISDGYNGTPTGFSNICEDCENQTLPTVLHAEANAITKLSKSTNSAEGSTLYVTLSPCFECAKLIIQAGIKRVIYSETYRNTDSFELFDQAGIEIKQIKI